MPGSLCFFVFTGFEGDTMSTNETFSCLEALIPAQVRREDPLERVEELVEHYEERRVEVAEYVERGVTLSREEFEALPWAVAAYVANEIWVQDYWEAENQGWYDSLLEQFLPREFVWANRERIWALGPRPYWQTVIREAIQASRPLPNAALLECLEHAMPHVKERARQGEEHDVLVALLAAEIRGHADELYEELYASRFA